MAKTSWRWKGYDEFQAYLRALPEESRAEALKHIEGGVNGAFVTVATVYDRHAKSGRLRRGLKIAITQKGRKLVSSSPIAWLFDNGSQARHWKSGKSTGAMWSKSPPTHIFRRTVEQTGRMLTEAFKAMLLRRGASKVTIR